MYTDYNDSVLVHICTLSNVFARTKKSDYLLSRARSGFQTLAVGTIILLILLKSVAFHLRKSSFHLYKDPDKKCS